MTEESWWTASSPWLHAIEMESVGALTKALPPQGITFTTRMDGTLMRDADGIFMQFYEKFQLPDYFGWNWAALRDCLRDLSWVPANNYMVIVENSSNVLSTSPGERDVFFNILTHCAESWASPEMKAGGARIPFNVILLDGP